MFSLKTVFYCLSEVITETVQKIGRSSSIGSNIALEKLAAVFNHESICSGRKLIPGEGSTTWA